MNKLKPEDVMRALDKLKYGGHSCHDCKYAKWSGEDRCGLNGCRIAKAALALLREKDAEIERLKKNQESVSAVCNRANEHYNDLYEQAKEILKAEARSEAITEFAERAKRRLPIVSPSVFDQIAEKLKGETDGKTDL